MAHEDTGTSEASLAAELAPSWSVFPGAMAPERSRTVDAYGVDIAVVEWGKESDPILLLAHGGADFARTFDVFGPLLAQGGFRVVSWDHRSHGDSAWAALQSWEADCRDAMCVLRSCLGGRPPGERVIAVGHSKGGGLMTHLTVVHPELFSCLVNIDGVPSKWRYRKEKASEGERIEKRQRWLESFLDHRRKAHQASRRPGTPEQLLKRRARHNPRLSEDWLRYLVSVGAKRDGDGWRWKLDPLVRMMGPGPWRPEWGIKTMAAVDIPTLAILGEVQEPMGWGTSAEEAREILPSEAKLVVYEDSGHFVHIEHAVRTAERVLEFVEEHQKNGRSRRELASVVQPEVGEGREANGESPVAVGEFLQTVSLTHGRVRLALHQIKAAEGAEAAGSRCPTLLCLHGLGSEASEFLPSAEGYGAWPGEVWALDLAGHGASEAAPGGGYSVEWVLGDIDAAVHRLGGSDACLFDRSVAIAGRGVGAYAAFLYAGSRPQVVASTLLAAGPGFEGGGAEPAAPTRIALPLDERNSGRARTPDELAVVELGSDVRPPGYAGVFARQIRSLGAGCEQGLPVWLCETEVLPDWLAEVEGECRRCGNEADGLREMARFCDGPLSA